MTILLGAGVARFADLGTNPGGLYPDEAAEALSARQILRDPGYRPVFLPEDGGREALFAYTVAAGFAVGGDSVATLRAVAAMWGVVGVLGAWLLARRFGVGAGLSGAAWAAGSLWLNVVSRDGFRTTITPFFAAAALASLLVWHSRPSRGTALLAGTTLALASLYTYHALKVLPILALVWLLWVRRADPRAFGAMRPGMPAFLLAYLVVGAPMIATAIASPQAWLGRVVGVTPFNPQLPQADAVAHVLRMLTMFTFAGDPNPRHNVAELPLLGWPLAVLAVIGLAKLWRNRKQAAHALVLLSIPMFLLPGLIAFEGASPHFLRVLGLAAPLAVAIGLGAQALYERLRTSIEGISRASGPRGEPTARAGRVSAYALALLFVALGLTSTATYLARPPTDRYAAFSGELVAMAELAQPTDALILDDFSLFTVEYLLDDRMPTRVKPGEPLTVAGIDRVLALSPDELSATLGSAVAAMAEAIAWNPLGRPAVWAVALN